MRRLLPKMPSSICCTNCRTKYSLLNREAGCSKCARSHCNKCLGYRAIIPNLSSQPMIVCYECYQKIEADKLKPEVVITSTPLPTSSSGNKNWWGDGLPPPSFRSTYGNPASTSGQFRPAPPPKPNRQYPPQQPQNHQIDELEQRISNLKDEPKEPPSMEELEERLARLRGCDVELIRNPKSWFTTSSGAEMQAQTPAELMKMAQDRARIEEKEENAEREELEELDARKRKVFDVEEDPRNEEDEINVRESVVSGGTEFSEATKEEMKEINSLLVDAEKRVAETKKHEEHDAAELRTLMKATRQKSLDAMQWNDKITKEIGGFWDRRNEKEGEEEDEDEKSLDEETFKKILHEAENSEDVPPPPPTTAKSPEVQSPSPKKKGFFGKLFRKDSKQ